MILSYVDAKTKKQLDRVTLTDTSVEYRTGRARTLVAANIDRYGHKAASKILRSWSNGYVMTSEISS